MAYTRWLSGERDYAPTKAAQHPLVWTEDTNIDMTETIGVAHHLASTIYFMDAVQAIVASPEFTVGHGNHWIHAQHPRVIILSSLIGEGRPIHAAVLLFHLLVSDLSLIAQSHMYATATAVKLRADAARGRALSITERALLATARYFDDIGGYHPLMTATLDVGHPILQSMVCIAARTFRRCFWRMDAFDAAVRAVVEQPWVLDTRSQFFKTFAEVMHGCAIPFAVVRLDSDGIVVRAQGHADCGTNRGISFLVDKCRGIVTTPRDKLLVTIVLLFSAECWTDAQGADTAASGLPEPLVSFIIRSRAPKPIPVYYGHSDGIRDEWRDV